MNKFDYAKWREEYVEKTGENYGQVDYYCTMLMRDSLYAGRNYTSVGSYLASKGVPYKKEAQFKAVEQLWDDLYGRVKFPQPSEETKDIIKAGGFVEKPAELEGREDELTSLGEALPSVAKEPKHSGGHRPKKSSKQPVSPPKKR